MTTYLTYCRLSEKARETHLDGLDTTDLRKATAAAKQASGHPLKELQPFYIAIYDENQSYPIAVFRAGEQVEGVTPADKEDIDFISAENA